MAIFCLKKIDKPVKVGTILKCRRKEKKIPIKKVVEQTHIPKQYLLALEKNLYIKLPLAKAHQVAYVRKYAQFLGLQTDNVIEQFTRESDLDNYQTIHPHKRIKIRPINSVVIWLRRLTLASLLLLFIGYIIWQINGILKPPKLVVFSPQEGFISETIKTKVQGTTDKEITLKINGIETNINEKGKFDTDINLSHGVNTITISATKKHGKTTFITRHVILKEDALLKLPTNKPAVTNN